MYLIKILVFYDLFFKTKANILFYLYLIPLPIWIILMSRMAHKEERFLFVVYPLICLGASFSLGILVPWLNFFILKIISKKLKVITMERITNVIVAVLLFIIILMSISRIISMVKNYSSPIYLYRNFNDIQINNNQNNSIHICTGKEWYRFPSNFFLPSYKYKLSFIESSFDGQLPNYYSIHNNATWIIPSNFNQFNKKEITRYVNSSICNYLIDLELLEQTEPFYSKDLSWKIIQKYKFLDNARSPSFLRAFYIPYFTPKYCKYNYYYLFKKI
jgi:alpha-1,2-mannosyltransferase